MSVTRTSKEAARSLARRSIRETISQLNKTRDKTNETLGEEEWVEDVIRQLDKIHNSLYKKEK